LAELTVRYFAGARTAAGRDSETLTMGPGLATVDDVVRELSDRHGPGLAKVLAACSYLLDEIAVRDRRTALPSGATLDVLPPFAGG
jgi:molybdopterin synthase sulfur carrier subunit